MVPTNFFKQERRENDMKLQSLKLTNFQGIKSLELVFDGKNASVYGDNGTGKTTIYNAFSWLLTGKSGTGEKGYTPKTNDAAGGEVHNLDHTAEMALDIDGQLVSLRKTFHEVWKKKRGSATKELTGNTTDSFINGVITKEKDYAEFVRVNVAPEERLRLLTQVDYFLEVMPWAKRRQVLVDLCGEMPDMDIIHQNEQLSDLTTFLAIPGTNGQQYYAVEEYRKIAASRKQDINRQLDILPGRIDEATKSIPDIPAGATEGDVRAQLESLRSDLKEVQGRRQMMSADYATKRIDSELATLRAEREAARAAHSAKEAERLKGGVDAALKLDQRVSELRQVISKRQLEIADTCLEKQATETKRTELLKSWNDYYDQVWD
ncbi:MAG: AAA family ATPase, partial [Clostridiales bacterium]|nr:AAA family ATPase [Clostridiales bacterium]